MNCKCFKLFVSFFALQIFTTFFIFSIQKVFHFFHLLQLQVFFTFLTSQNELKTVWIYMFFTAFLPQKCLKFFSPRPSLCSDLGIVKNISSGGSAWKKNIFFAFETKELSCFSYKFIRCFFNHFSFYLFSFFFQSSNLSFFPLYCLT